jgi:hypothetical protein
MLPVGANEWPIDHVLGDEPDLHLAGRWKGKSNDRAEKPEREVL